jgi:hypothetical protein
VIRERRGQRKPEKSKRKQGLWRHGRRFGMAAG